MQRKSLRAHNCRTGCAKWWKWSNFNDKQQCYILLSIMCVVCVMSKVWGAPARNFTGAYSLITNTFIAWGSLRPWQKRDTPPQISLCIKWDLYIIIINIFFWHVFWINPRCDINQTQLPYEMRMLFCWKGFCESICRHVCCWNPLNCNFAISMDLS